MKTVILALCYVLFATQAFGQQAPQPHKGRSKAIWTGAGLLVAGLIVMPMKHSPISSSPDGGSGRYNAPMIGLGLAATGGALIYWGVRDQRKRAHPNITIGVMFRRTAGIQIHRNGVRHPCMTNRLTIVRRQDGRTVRLAASTETVLVPGDTLDVMEINDGENRCK